MELFYFYSNKSNSSWYDARIEAWREETETYDRDGKKICSYHHLETISCHINKTPQRFHSCRFDHDYGKDSCQGHHAKTRNEFIKAKTERGILGDLEQIDYRTFLRLRKVLLNIHRRYPAINYTEILMKDSPVSRIIF